MPNHVINVLKIKNLKPEDVEATLNRITIQLEDDIYPLNCVIDFNKIIPEPTVEADCPDDCKRTEKSCVEEDKDRPWFDWYEWHRKYWGTKWNAYECYTKIGKSYITFVFQTAWNAPYPIYEQLKEWGYNFEVQYADEDWGSNCGKYIYDPAKTGFEDIVHIRADDLANPRRYAQYLWNKYE